jgi:Zn-dependent protease with chaperone function
MGDGVRLQRACAAAGLVAIVVVGVTLVSALNGLVARAVPTVEVFIAIAVGSVALASLVEGAVSALRQARRQRRLVAQVRAAAVDESGGVVVVEDRDPLAFCAGLLHPRVFVSTGALDLLSADELAAVLDHELHHARRHDPLRALLGHALAEALFFVPAASRLADRHAAALELTADAAAAADRRRRSALAAAMLAVPADVAAERVDRLLGGPVRAGVDPAAVVGATASLSLMAAGGFVLVDEALVRFVLHEVPPEPLTALMSAGPLLLGGLGLCLARRRRAAERVTA